VGIGICNPQHQEKRYGGKAVVAVLALGFGGMAFSSWFLVRDPVALGFLVCWFWFVGFWLLVFGCWLFRAWLFSNDVGHRRRSVAAFAEQIAV